MKKNILLIDDDEMIVRSLRKLLEKNNFNVLTAKTGQGALAIAEAEPFALIVADIRMPGLNGVETVQSIYTVLEDKKQKKIPVIFITGYAGEEMNKEAHALNPVAYIYKPFDIPELVGIVKKILDAPAERSNS